MTDRAAKPPGAPKNLQKKFFLPPSIPAHIFAWVIERERRAALTVETSGDQKAALLELRGGESHDFCRRPFAIRGRSPGHCAGTQRIAGCITRRSSPGHFADEHSELRPGVARRLKSAGDDGQWR